MANFDIVYRYTYERQLGYFEMADFDELFETRYKSEIVKAENKQLAVQDFLSTHKNINNIVSVREMTPKYADKGREL